MRRKISRIPFHEITNPQQVTNTGPQHLIHHKPTPDPLGRPTDRKLDEFFFCCQCGSGPSLTALHPLCISCEHRRCQACGLETVLKSWPQSTKHGESATMIGSRLSPTHSKDRNCTNDETRELPLVSGCPFEGFSTNRVQRKESWCHRQFGPERSIRYVSRAVETSEGPETAWDLTRSPGATQSKILGGVRNVPQVPTIALAGTLHNATAILHAGPWARSSLEGKGLFPPDAIITHDAEVRHDFIVVSEQDRYRNASDSSLGESSPAESHASPSTSVTSGTTASDLISPGSESGFRGNFCNPPSTYQLQKALLDTFMQRFIAWLHSGLRERADGNSPKRKRTGNDSATSNNVQNAPTRQSGARRDTQQQSDFRRPSDNGSDQSEDDGDRPGKRVRTPADKSNEGSSGRRFVCPYYKRRPHLYRNFRTCSGPGWAKVHHVK